MPIQIFSRKFLSQLVAYRSTFTPKIRKFNSILKKIERQQLNRELENIFDMHYKPLYIPAGRSVVKPMTDFLGEFLLSSGGIRPRIAMQNFDYATQRYVREVLLLRKFFS